MFHSLTLVPSPLRSLPITPCGALYTFLSSPNAFSSFFKSFLKSAVLAERGKTSETHYKCSFPSIFAPILKPMVNGRFYFLGYQKNSPPKCFLTTKKAAKSTGSSLFCCSSVTSQLQTPTRHLYVVWNPSSVSILFSFSDSDRSRYSELSLGMVLYRTES